MIKQGGNFRRVAYLAIFILASLCFYLQYELSVGRGNNIRAIIESYSLGYTQGATDRDAYYGPLLEQIYEQMMEQYK